MTTDTSAVELRDKILSCQHVIYRMKDGDHRRLICELGETCTCVLSAPVQPDVAAKCHCGMHEIPAYAGTIKWYWQEHTRERCSVTLPNLRCWCGRLRSEHTDGHADNPEAYERLEAKHRAEAMGTPPSPPAADAELVSACDKILGVGGYQPNSEDCCLVARALRTRLLATPEWVTNMAAHEKAHGDPEIGAGKPELCPGDNSPCCVGLFSNDEHWRCGTSACGKATPKRAETFAPLPVMVDSLSIPEPATAPLPEDIENIEKRWQRNLKRIAAFNPMLMEKWVYIAGTESHDDLATLLRHIRSQPARKPVDEAAAYRLGAMNAFTIASVELRQSASHGGQGSSLEHAWAEQFAQHSIPEFPGLVAGPVVTETELAGWMQKRYEDIGGPTQNWTIEARAIMALINGSAG